MLLPFPQSIIARSFAYRCKPPFAPGSASLRACCRAWRFARPNACSIWVDADACPKPIEEIQGRKGQVLNSQSW